MLYVRLYVWMYVCGCVYVWSVCMYVCLYCLSVCLNGRMYVSVCLYVLCRYVMWCVWERERENTQHTIMNISHKQTLMRSHMENSPLIWDFANFQILEFLFRSGVWVSGWFNTRFRRMLRYVVLSIFSGPSICWWFTTFQSYLPCPQKEIQGLILELMMVCDYSSLLISAEESHWWLLLQIMLLLLFIIRLMDLWRGLRA